jgi:hypothetical protein
VERHPGAQEQGIDLLERGRGSGAPVVLSGQSYRSLGDEDTRDRLVSAADALVLFGSATPDELVRLAGTVLQAEAVYATEDGVWSGKASVTHRHRAKVDANSARQLGVGEAIVISRGRAARMLVIPAPGTNNDLALPRRPFASSVGVPDPPSPPQARRRPRTGRLLPCLTRRRRPRPGTPFAPGGARSHRPTTTQEVMPSNRPECEAGAGSVVGTLGKGTHGPAAPQSVAPQRRDARGPDHEGDTSWPPRIIPSPARRAYAGSASTPLPTGSPSTWTAASGGPPAPAAGSSWPRDDTGTGSSARQPADPAICVEVT